MIVALIDIERRAPRTEEHSPRWDGRTVAALERRGLVGGTPGPKSIARGVDPLARSLTAKGKAYLDTALGEASHSNFERSTARRLVLPRVVFPAFVTALRRLLGVDEEDALVVAPERVDERISQLAGSGLRLLLRACEKVHTCVPCGAVFDRDYNATQNMIVVARAVFNSDPEAGIVKPRKPVFAKRHQRKPEPPPPPPVRASRSQGVSA